MLFANPLTGAIYFHYWYNRVKTGVVLLNLGGPKTQEEVEPFLRRLFSDREIIQMPLPERIQTEYLGPLIAKRRSPRIRAQYQAIGKELF